MDFRQHTQDDSQAMAKPLHRRIAAFFTAVFTKAEGDAEGKMVGQLAKDLLEKTAEHDLYGFIAVDKGKTYCS